MSEYDYDEEEFDDAQFEEAEDIVAQCKGTIARGDCMLCGAKNAMEYVGDICFICDECGQSVHENLYYLWINGWNITDSGF